MSTDVLSWSDSVPQERCPVPEPQSRLSARDPGKANDEDQPQFLNLLMQLNDQHETELNTLRSEVVRLKERLSAEGASTYAVSSQPGRGFSYWMSSPNPSLLSLLDGSGGQPKQQSQSNLSALQSTAGVRNTFSTTRQVSDVDRQMHARSEGQHMMRWDSRDSPTMVERWELLPQWSDTSRIHTNRTRLASIFEYVEHDKKYRFKASRRKKQDGDKIGSPTMNLKNARPWRCLGSKADSELDQSNQFPLIHPNAQMKEVWDFIGLIILAIDAIWIPLQVFDMGQALFIQLLDGFITCFWTLDMYISFVCGYYDSHGNLVMSFPQIAKRYLRSWFGMDIVILGSDWYMISRSVAETEDAGGAGDSFGLARLGKMMRFARFLRALRLVHLLKFRQLLYRLQESISSERFAIVCGVCNNIVLVAVLQHYTACVWYWIGKQSSGHTWVKEYIHADEGIIPRYLLSLHWCLAQFTPAPLGITPQNQAERCFNVILIFVSLIVFSSFMSSITTSMVRLKSLGSEYTVQVFMLRKFLKDNRISAELAARVSRYIDLAVDMHKKRTDRSQVALLNLLSGPLNILLQRELFEPHLLRHVLFKEFKKVGSAALSQVCFSAMSEALVSKGDVLFMAGSMSYSMWFLDSGSMVYRCMKHLHQKARIRRSTRVPTGTSICEAVLWVEWFHHGTMISLIESDLVKLDAQKFRDITMDNPSAMAFACKYAIEFILKSREQTLLDIPFELATRAVNGKERSSNSRAGAQTDGVEVTSAELMEAQLVSLAAASTTDSDPGSSDLESDSQAHYSESVASSMNGVVP